MPKHQPTDLRWKRDKPLFSPAGIISSVPALRRLIPSVLRRYAKTFKHRYSIESRMGALFVLDQKNSVDRNLLIKGTWEPNQINKLKTLISENASKDQKTVFLDIGAHGALYSIILLKEKLAERIIAFEPEPTNLAQLNANLFINHVLGEIEVINKAASDKKGKIPFFVAQEGNRGGSRMTETEKEILEREIQVDAAPIDSVVSLENSFVVAKIDVEGSELTVLSGMLKTIKNNRCLFQIESFDQQLPELRDWMEARGCEHLATVDFDHYFLKN